MKSTITLTLVDGVTIIVPDSLDVLTTYVLQEHQDWFEDEIKFVRHLLQPGDNVIDIGANFGVYTLSMAKSVGSTGRVWAFEPASKTASFLTQSISSNDFGHVKLEQKALSNKAGEAKLSLDDNPEMNALVSGNENVVHSESVTLTTLDDSMDSCDWSDIEFVKLDAEGEEKNILLGGADFFDRESPLVQYEVKVGEELHLDLVHAFSEIGYDSYRLVPGLNILIPFDENEQADEFLLNLFSCEPDRAKKLADRGLLIRQTEPQHGMDSDGLSGDWLASMTALPYGKICAEVWRSDIAEGKSAEIKSALALYWLSRDASKSAEQRFAALKESFLTLKAVCETQPSYLRLSSLARVAREYGARAESGNALTILCGNIFQKGEIDLSEPFLPPGVRFDTLPPNETLPEWVAAGAVEELERNSSYSSFYTPELSKQRLETIHDLGFGSPEMERRMELLQRQASAR